MSGSYPDVPSDKMAYDDDGSVGFQLSLAGVITALTSGQLTSLNAYNPSTMLPGSNGYTGVIFPQLRDLAAVFTTELNAGTARNFDFATSNDTTNGQDGTWTARGTVVGYGPGESTVRMRNNISAKVVSGIKAVRISLLPVGVTVFSTLHLYGTIETPTDLCLWHPTLDQRIETTPAFADFADIARSTNVIKQLRVKNTHITQTANGVVLSTQILTDASPTLVGQLQFSADGSTGWANTLNVGNIAPGSISPVFYVRDAPSSGAQLGLWWPRFKAAATSWT